MHTEHADTPRTFTAALPTDPLIVVALADGGEYSLRFMSALLCSLPGNLIHSAVALALPAGTLLDSSSPQQLPFKALLHENPTYTMTDAHNTRFSCYTQWQNKPSDIHEDGDETDSALTTPARPFLLNQVSCMFFSTKSWSTSNMQRNQGTNYPPYSCRRICWAWCARPLTYLTP